MSADRPTRRAALSARKRLVNLLTDENSWQDPPRSKSSRIGAGGDGAAGGAGGAGAQAEGAAGRAGGATAGVAAAASHFANSDAKGGQQAQGGSDVAAGAGSDIELAAAKAAAMMEFMRQDTDLYDVYINIPLSEQVDICRGNTALYQPSDSHSGVLFCLIAKKLFRQDVQYYDKSSKKLCRDSLVIPAPYMHWLVNGNAPHYTSYPHIYGQDLARHKGFYFEEDMEDFKESIFDIGLSECLCKDIRVVKQLPPFYSVPKRRFLTMEQFARFKPDQRTIIANWAIDLRFIPARSVKHTFENVMDIDLIVPKILGHCYGVHSWTSIVHLSQVNKRCHSACPPAMKAIVLALIKNNLGDDRSQMPANPDNDTSDAMIRFYRICKKAINHQTIRGGLFQAVHYTITNVKYRLSWSSAVLCNPFLTDGMPPDAVCSMSIDCDGISLGSFYPNNIPLYLKNLTSLTLFNVETLMPGNLAKVFPLEHYPNIQSLKIIEVKESNLAALMPKFNKLFRLEIKNIYPRTLREPIVLPPTLKRLLVHCRSDYFVHYGTQPQLFDLSKATRLLKMNLAYMELPSGLPKSLRTIELSYVIVREEINLPGLDQLVFDTCNFFGTAATVPLPYPDYFFQANTNHSSPSGIAMRSLFNMLEHRKQGPLYFNLFINATLVTDYFSQHARFTTECVDDEIENVLQNYTLTNQHKIVLSAYPVHNYTIRAKDQKILVQITDEIRDHQVKRIKEMPTRV